MFHYVYYPYPESTATGPNKATLKRESDLGEGVMEKDWRGGNRFKRNPSS